MPGIEQCGKTTSPTLAQSYLTDAVLASSEPRAAFGTVRNRLGTGSEQVRNRFGTVLERFGTRNRFGTRSEPGREPVRYRFGTGSEPVRSGSEPVRNWFATESETGRKCSTWAPCWSRRQFRTDSPLVCDYSPHWRRRTTLIGYPGVNRPISKQSFQFRFGLRGRFNRPRAVSQAGFAPLFAASGAALNFSRLRAVSQTGFAPQDPQAHSEAGLS